MQPNGVRQMIDGRDLNLIQRILYGYPRNGKFPTWRYKYLRIQYVERDPYAVGFGISLETDRQFRRGKFDGFRGRELTLTIWRTNITWRL